MEPNALSLDFFDGNIWPQCVQCSLVQLTAAERVAIEEAEHVFLSLA